MKKKKNTGARTYGGLSLARDPNCSKYKSQLSQDFGFSF